MYIAASEACVAIDINSNHSTESTFVITVPTQVNLIAISGSSNGEAMR